MANSAGKTQAGSFSALLFSEKSKQIRMLDPTTFPWCDFIFDTNAAENVWPFFFNDAEQSQPPPPKSEHNTSKPCKHDV